MYGRMVECAMYDRTVECAMYDRMVECAMQCSAQVFKRAGCHLKRAHLAR